MTLSTLFSSALSLGCHLIIRESSIPSAGSQLCRWAAENGLRVTSTLEHDPAYGSWRDLRRSRGAFHVLVIGERATRHVVDSEQMWVMP